MLTCCIALPPTITSAAKNRCSSKGLFRQVKATQMLAAFGLKEYHYRLTRREFIGRRRERIPKSRRFETPLIGLQPSQLWISEGKLRLVREWFDPARRESFDPIPVKRLGGRILMTDGHTRAVAAHLAGWESVPVYWDEDELDMRAYAADVAWCDGEGILSPVDLAARIVPHRDYERLWRKRCMEMKLD